jgi:hypothetical protein
MRPAMSDSPGPRSGVDPKHVVQFYEDDRFLCEIVADFSREGLAKGEAVILVATGPHRREVERRLTERGIDVGGLKTSGQLVLVDARRTLDSFMVEGGPDAELFLSNLRSLVVAATLDWKRAVRVYGEMVDLLWRDGDRGAAIRLEETWNAFARATSTRVLCGYAMDGFGQEGDAADFARVCELHTDVQEAEADLLTAPVSPITRAS